MALASIPLNTIHFAAPGNTPKAKAFRIRGDYTVSNRGCDYAK